MFDFHEKRKIRSALYSRPVVIFLFVVAFFLSISAYNRYSVAREMSVKLDTKKMELQEMQERAEMIGAKVEYLKNERGVEEELRSRFDAIREGEQVVVFLNHEKETLSQVSTATVDNDNTKKESSSFFEKIRAWWADDE